MFLNGKITTSTKDCSDKLKQVREHLQKADAVIIGAGAGLSTSAGFTYTGQRFQDNFSDFIEKYGFTDMYSGGFFPFESLEEYWAYWSRYVNINRYIDSDNGTYGKLLEIVKDKDYFVLTTNVDHQFQKAGFDKRRLFYTQGDYGLWQCSKPCHNKTYDNEETISRMIAEQIDMKIPSELIPHCPICGAPMTMNLRSDDTFVEDEGWHRAAERYSEFIRRHKNLHVLFLELGVGMNTPGIIKYPFWKMTYENPDACYISINYGEAYAPSEINKKSVCIQSDIKDVLFSL
ncbi:MAG: Sir2 silent information regulator family NAD-dependent deacetylase [Firmicutes bacterium]|nr:Sir2 silent information regulator family NAD-dependent deacetylase [Bacillota bacterium]